MSDVAPGLGAIEYVQAGTRGAALDPRFREDDELPVRYGAGATPVDIAQAKAAQAKASGAD
jgi:hypothetical protein